MTPLPNRRSSSSSKLDAGVAGECGPAVTDEHRINEELALIDQPGVERVRGEGRPADGQVAADGGTPLTRYVQARVPKCDIRPSSDRRHGSRVLEPAIRGRSSVGGAGRAGRQRHGHRADHAVRWCAVVLVEDFDTGCTSGSGDAHGD